MKTTSKTTPLRLRPVHHKSLQETTYQGKLKNGLTVIFVPKEGYFKKFAILAADYGAIDRDFVDRRDGKRIQQPAGVAHFLEHCLFAKEEGDICDEFAKFGASANAGTGFSSTSYLFSCSNQFDRNLSLLVDLVQTPYFNEEVVEKERGIIEQEIGMYADSAEWKLFMNLLDGLYHNHPVRVDIAGTVKSIGEITTDVLRACHATFYHPANMALIVVGDLKPENVAKTVTRLAQPSTNGKPSQKAEPIQRFLPREPRSICRREIEEKLPVSHPKLLVGFKDTVANCTPLELTRKDTAISLLLDLVFGKSSELYNQLYDSGLIDDSFSASYNADRSFAFSAVGGDTPDPPALHQALLTGIRKIKRRGIDEKDFRRIRDKAYGRFFQSFNSVEGIAYTMMHHHFRGSNVTEQLSILKTLKKEELEARAMEHLRPSLCAISTVRPK